MSSENWRKDVDFEKIAEDVAKLVKERPDDLKASVWYSRPGLPSVVIHPSTDK